MDHRGDDKRMTIGNGVVTRRAIGVVGRALTHGDERERMGRLCRTGGLILEACVGQVRVESKSQRDAACLLHMGPPGTASLLPRTETGAQLAFRQQRGNNRVAHLLRRG